MAGAHSRQKGRRFENEVVGVLNANRYSARRVSEAGMPGPDIETFGGRFCEAKIRQLIPAFIRQGLRDASIFFFREDGGPIMVAMELDELFDLFDWVKGKQLPDQLGWLASGAHLDENGNPTLDRG